VLHVRATNLPVRIVLKLCDELDKAKELHAYYIEILQNYIKEHVKPALITKHNEDLL